MDNCHARDQYTSDFAGHGKNCFDREENPEKKKRFPLGGEHPQKEKVERYAASFQKLADTFYGMPYKKEYLSSAQVENVIRETGERFCRNCYRRELCWGDHAEEMYLCGEAMVRAIEQADEEKIRRSTETMGRELRQISAVSGSSEGLFSEGKAGDDLGKPDDREPACGCTAAE